ncbi:MAG: ECF transporter S component, partial [Firmicutes bacterium]|nr:ECF transporter S component [Bacillota bacterium]
MNTNTKTKVSRTGDSKIRTMVAVAVFTALAYVCCVLFHFKLSFLSFDLKDAVMAVGAMFFGPAYGFAMVVLVAFLEMITISSTGVYGFIMNIISSTFFVCVCSIIYKYRRTMAGAVFGMICSVISMTAAMMIANIIITPHFMGTTTEAVIEMIPTILFPFNLTKAIFNASLSFIIYKPVS